MLLFLERIRRRLSTSWPHFLLVVLPLLTTLSAQNVDLGIHKRFPTFNYSSDSHHLVRRGTGNPLKLTNTCSEDIYPGVQTQAGTGPDTTGFKLSPGESRTLTVSSDWQGRTWGRTNCSFSDSTSGPSNRAGFATGGKVCGTGDCAGLLECKGTGETPVTLAEFTLDSPTSQAYYDISIVDGYNIPMAILYIVGPTQKQEDIPPNLTNPVCIGTADLLASIGYDPYQDAQTHLGTNSSTPLPLDQSAKESTVQRWCPWDLQLNPPSKPGDGVYPYPDDNIARPTFNPCYSACAKHNDPKDCCTGAYNGPTVCSPSLYSKNAKVVCPDAYSFAYDDRTSTFIVPAGGGAEVIFCPQGRSTNILTTNFQAVLALSQKGGGTKVSPVQRKSGAVSTRGSRDLLVLVCTAMAHLWVIAAEMRLRIA
ncbi:MAG: hypothetical protein M1814_002614 [Vezdaea aestivalis]|nr:MAG: hypothetical protein M1814_002614 [Vezdaea aestivalis]